MNINILKIFFLSILLVGCAASRHMVDITGDNGNRYIGNGDRYVGEAIDGKPDGQGTFYGHNGTNYIGAFKNGLFNGQGKYLLASGEIFVGTFKDGAAISGQGFAKDGTPIASNSANSDTLNNIILLGIAAWLIHNAVTSDSTSSSTDSECEEKIQRCLSRMSMDDGLYYSPPWNSAVSQCKKKVCN